METERIWLFISALVVIPAAGVIVKIESQKFKKQVLLSIYIILLVQVIFFEILFFTVW